MIIRRPTIGKHPLEEFEWDDKSGLATLVYADGAKPDRQPMRPGHEGWSTLGRRTLQTREIEIGDRVDAQVVGIDADFCWQYL